MRKTLPETLSRRSIKSYNTSNIYHSFPRTLFAQRNSTQSKMASSIPKDAEQVLNFWFNDSYTNNECSKELLQKWFSKDSELDKEIESKFGQLIDQARNKHLDEWKNNGLSASALIILVDQFSRNIFRGSPKSFDCDNYALDLSKHVISNHQLEDLTFKVQMFVLMPFMHAEDIQIQEEGVQRFNEMAQKATDTSFEGIGEQTVKFAKEHRDIVQKFGRFPHRNAVMGRENTKDEEEFLKVHSGF
eukprot:gb/GECH01004074.1/.p1 GENE.gb/GECH01004074.1/~~gb/GECH01004074.1/.p1  ORF type:complete len:245 (+),score=80.36 gb/GECH01004074.1/:1-735(+)